MARITTLTDFRNYLKLTLGQPVILVEIADEQYDQIIEDSVQDFQRYTYGEATYRDVLTIAISAGTSAYQLDPEVIDSVFDISLSHTMGDINQLFSPQHTLLYNDFINGSVLGIGGAAGGSAGLGGAMSLASYDTAMIYLKEIEDHFARKYTADFNPNSGILRVWPTPNENSVALLQLFKKETAVNLYNNPLLKKLARARCMIQWAYHLGKYSTQLAGSSTINYSMFLEKGEKDEAAALEAIRMESEPPIFLCG